MKTFRLDIMTPDVSVPSMNLVSLDVPAVNGRLTILADHAPLVCSVVAGRTRILRPDTGKDEVWSTGPGTLSVRKNEVTLLLASASEPTSQALPR